MLTKRVSTGAPQRVTAFTVPEDPEFEVRRGKVVMGVFVGGAALGFVALAMVGNEFLQVLSGMLTAAAVLGAADAAAGLRKDSAASAPGHELLRV